MNIDWLQHSSYCYGCKKRCCCCGDIQMGLCNVSCMNLQSAEQSATAKTIVLRFSPSVKQAWKWRWGCELYRQALESQKQRRSNHDGDLLSKRLSNEVPPGIEPCPPDCSTCKSEDYNITPKPFLKLQTALLSLRRSNNWDYIVSREKYNCQCKKQQQQQKFFDFIQLYSRHNTLKCY